LVDLQIRVDSGENFGKMLLVNVIVFQKKGTQMTVKVTRLYRREDLLSDSLSLLETERREAGVEENNQDILVRELFPSDTHLTQSVAVLR
jgi:hypothetical protein